MNRPTGEPPVTQINLIFLGVEDVETFRATLDIPDGIYKGMELHINDEPFARIAFALEYAEESSFISPMLIDSATRDLKTRFGRLHD